MSTISRVETGELLQQSEVICSIEWTIKGIFSYTEKDQYLFSPSFSVADSLWLIQIYPNGQSREASVGWITLYFRRRDDFKFPKCITCTFGVKKADGTVEQVGEDNRWAFFDSEGFGYLRFLERSVLQQRRYELTSSGSLTVTCFVQMKDSLEYVLSLLQLSENFKEMFLSQKDCDATLKVQEKEFPVHKFVLASRCPLLDVAFKNTDVVDMKYIKPRPFKDFLLYLYSGEFQNDYPDAFELYRIANMFDVKGLKSDCVRYLQSNLSQENVFEAALFGHRYGEKELQNTVENFFTQNFSKIVSNAKWDSFLKEHYSLANKLLKSMAEKIK